MRGDTFPKAQQLNKLSTQSFVTKLPEGENIANWWYYGDKPGAALDTSVNRSDASGIT
jgi:hypothetical protein